VDDQDLVGRFAYAPSVVVGGQEVIQPPRRLVGGDGEDP
jgi:hypothetical protein